MNLSNEGFSGGEKKRNEILLNAPHDYLLLPFWIKIDSGLDIDAPQGGIHMPMPCEVKVSDPLLSPTIKDYQLYHARCGPL